MVVLGIDIGTSKVAAVLLGAEDKPNSAASLAHRADLKGPSGHSEQSPLRILEAVRQLMLGLSTKDLRDQVAAVGVTGQMHGVVLADAQGSPLSPLFTWQDLRCERDGVLPGLRQRTGHALSTGFGCATLAYLAAKGQLPTSAASSGTIGDWFVAQLCGEARPVTDPTDAASWGLFDLSALAWDRKAVDMAGIRPGLLPEVLPCSSMAGRVCEPMGRLLGIPAGIPVAVALGDNQASLLATLEEPDVDLGLTLGTGGQISAVMRAGWKGVAPGPGARFEYRPYVGGRYVAVASALCGGSAWQWLVASVEGWLKDLGIRAPARDDLYARLDQLGLAASRAPEVHPHFLGERYDPGLRGSISGVGVDDFTLGNLALGLAHGIIRNLANMLPEDIRAERSRVVGSGNALRKSALLRKAAAEELKAELIMANQREEAACGAAKNALIMLQSAGL